MNFSINNSVYSILNSLYNLLQLIWQELLAHEFKFQLLVSAKWKVKLTNGGSVESLRGAGLIHVLYDHRLDWFNLTRTCHVRTRFLVNVRTEKYKLLLNDDLRGFQN